MHGIVSMRLGKRHLTDNTHFSQITMKLYIINEVLSDYTPGMVVIAAPSLDACKEIFAEEFKFDDIGEFDSAIKDGNYKVIENVNHDACLVSHVYGGG